MNQPPPTIAVIALILSALALLFTVFSFWWNNVREKKRFYFMLLNTSFNEMGAFTFVLVNAGSKDVLVNNLHLTFYGDEPGVGYLPRHTMRGVDDRKAFLIQAGKAIELSLVPQPEEVAEFASKGRPSKKASDRFCFDVKVDLQWADMSANAYMSSLTHSQVVVDELGKLWVFAPWGYKDGRVNLYEDKTRVNFGRVGGGIGANYDVPSI